MDFGTKCEIFSKVPRKWTRTQKYREVCGSLFTRDSIYRSIVKMAYAYIPSVSNFQDLYLLPKIDKVCQKFGTKMGKISSKWENLENNFHE